MADNRTKFSNQLSDILEQYNKDEVIRLVPMLTFLLLISVIGIPGNGLVCYIYSTKYGASSSRWFIFFLASADLVMCVVVVPCELATSLYQYNFTNGVVCKLTAFLNSWSLMTLALILVIVSVDRYRKVCRSLGWQIDFRRARILSVVAILVAFLNSFPLWWIYGINSYDHGDFNVTVSECSTSSSAFAVYFIMFGMVIFISSLVTICVLYCFIGRDIKLHLRKEQVRRQVSLSASMAHRDAVYSSVSPRDVIISMKQSGIFRYLKTDNRTTVQFKPERKLSPPSNDGSLDEPSLTNNLTDGDTFDFEPTPPPSKPLERKKTKRVRRARARKATFSMFLISLAFVLSYLPLLLLLLIRSIESSFEAGLSDTGRAVYKFFLRSYFLNCSINPFIYGLSDSRFRENFKDIVCKVWRRLKCR